MAFYRKNIGGMQQVARIALGLAGAGAALVLLAPPLSLAGAAAGAMFALTGLVGYCPICAAAGVGRRDAGVR
ncbi:MAG: YgaP-like transmembrane domain [Phreatobacter sp.]